MHQVSLAATARPGNGKGVARSLRREGRVPAVIYGHGRQAQSLTVEQAAVQRLLDVIGGETVLVDVAIDGGTPVKAIVREVQRNPVKRSEVIHLDLYAVVADEAVTVEVPVHLVGTADGVRNHGGVIDHHLHRVSIRCLPADIPEHIDVNVTALQVGQSIHVRDLVLAKGELLHDGDVTVVGVLASRAEVSADAPAGGEPEVIKKGKADEAEAAGS